jgi:GSH-dependent disulfide-bond oxidoreductase
MIDLYTYETPNGQKASIMLEEVELPYVVRTVDLMKGEQRDPDFLRISPNNKVPAIVDHDGIDGRTSVFESGAILVYLAEKTGKLLPTSGEGRARVFEQLFFHASGLGPAFGQAGFFQRFAAEPQPIAIERFSTEAKRTLGLLDQVLANHSFVAGDEFTIADIAHFGWLWRREFAVIDFAESPHVARWYTEVEARPAVRRALERVNALVPQA